MQKIAHLYTNKSPIFTMIEALYSYVSDMDYMFEEENVLWLDDSFKTLSDILNEYLPVYRKPKMKALDLKNVLYTFKNLDTDSKGDVTVCLSGGKDSAAAAYYLKQQGYNVHLYHAVGVNKAYGDEKNAAKRIAEYLDCDLYIDVIKVIGLKSFIEHPLKNYIIANGAIHYAIAKHYAPVIAFGNFYKSTLEMNEFEICGGDCIEMWNAYKEIIRRVIPKFDILIPLATNADTFRILKNDWKLFSMSVSCMSPYRFREHWKHRAEQKFNVKLFDNRCGVCWKCCVENIWLMDNGDMVYNEAYFKHCLGILIYAILKETGNTVTVEEAWDNYMFYPIKESHAYKFIDCDIRYHSASAAVIDDPPTHITNSEASEK